MNESLKRWSRVLVFVACGAIVFGAAMVLLGPPFVAATGFGQVDPVFFGASVPAPTLAFQRFVYGVLGATVAGLGALVAFVAHHAIARAQTWAARAVLLSLLAWFVLDCGASIYAGVWANVALNVVCFVALAAPTVMAWRAMIQRPEAQSH